MDMFRPQRTLSVWRNRVSTVSCHCEGDRGSHSVIDLAWILMPVSDRSYRRDGHVRGHGFGCRSGREEGDVFKDKMIGAD
ncbi:unnamed protein product [Nezara viridula]|uniref:Uncharacterized protein n=1 Tax=Nezara viridula TaxID=85310 RepID=A0A9P0HNK2_NEZVI|nr:unnamed protein product [Nezara viridula]